MGVVAKRKMDDGMYAGFDVGVEIKNSPVSNPKDYVAWVFHSNPYGSAFELESKTKIPRTLNDTFYVPKIINGRKLKKLEMAFLLTAQKNLDGLLTGNPEVTLPLLNAYRKRVARATLLPKIWTGAFFSGTVASAAAFGLVDYFSMDSSFFQLSLFGLIVAAAGKYVWSDSKKEVHRKPAEVISKMPKEEVPELLEEFHSYINNEWNSINSQYWKDQQFISGGTIPLMQNSLDPRQIEKYREYYATWLSKKAEAVSSVNSPAISPSSGNWVGRLAALENVKAEWMAWEMDILKVVKYPALFDMREPTTAAFHKEMAYAEALTPKESDGYSLTHPFIKATADLSFAWSSAKSEAERISQSKFDTAERTRLTRALDLLRMALDTSGNPAERQSSYKQAMKQLDGLVRVPSQAVESLESGLVMKALEPKVD